MNKFITTDVGGLPIVLDDFRFVDDSVREALEGSLSGYGSEFVLSGATGTSNSPNIDVAEGFVYFEGEIFKVPAHSIAEGAAAYWFDVDSTFDAAGLKNFQAGGSFDTYEVRKARLQSGASVPAGKLEFVEADLKAESFTEAIRKKVQFQSAINTSIQSAEVALPTDASFFNCELTAGQNQIDAIEARPDGEIISLHLTFGQSSTTLRSGQTPSAGFQALSIPSFNPVGNTDIIVKASSTVSFISRNGLWLFMGSSNTYELAIKNETRIQASENKIAVLEKRFYNRSVALINATYDENETDLMSIIPDGSINVVGNKMKVTVSLVVTNSTGAPATYDSGKFRIYNDTTIVRTIDQTLERNGEKQVVTIVASMDYTAGETVKLTGESSTVGINQTISDAEIIAETQFGS